MKAISKDILIRKRRDKTQFVFYNDQSIDFKPDEHICQLWRNASVQGMTEDDIEAYLNNQGFKSMQAVSTGCSDFTTVRWKKRGRKQQPTKITHNQFLAGILKDYGDPST